MGALNLSPWTYLLEFKFVTVKIVNVNFILLTRFTCDSHSLHITFKIDLNKTDKSNFSFLVHRDCRI